MSGCEVWVAVREISGGTCGYGVRQRGGSEDGCGDAHAT